MKILDFFKKKRQTFHFTPDKCQKTHERGQELTKLMQPQIKSILSKYYQNELNSPHFLGTQEKPKEVFESASVGLSILKLVDIVEKTDDNPEIIKNCLKCYQEIYAKISKGCIYNHVMKFVQDYKFFTESEAPSQIQDKHQITTCFTGAWVIRYYIGEDATISYASSIEIGKIIEDTIQDLWVAKI